MSKIAAICVVRNAVDLVPWSCGYYLHAGFDRVSFIDDHSDDGTLELLRRFAERDARVSVETSRLANFDQEKLTNEQANAHIKMGFEVILPFDIDEFWNTDAASLRALFSQRDEGLVFGDWVHMVPDTGTVRNSNYSLLRAVHRAPIVEGTEQASVQAFQKSFVCHTMPKVAVKARRPIGLYVGNHGVHSGPSDVVSRSLEIFHVPLRSEWEIRARGANRARIRATQPDAGLSWQADHFADAVLSGRVEEVWAANSAGRDGCLSLGNEKIATTRDTRLRTRLLFALGYMLRRGLPFPWLASRHRREEQTR